MTTKPRAKKYRIRRSGSLAGGTGSGQQDPQSDANPMLSGSHGHEDGFGDEPFPTAAGAGDSEANKAELDAIKKEGLTGRQLRLARKVAQKRGLPFSSDFDAVRVLRANGIDPFKRATTVEMVTSADGKEADAAPAGRANLPKTLPQDALPAPQFMDESARAKEILQIQRDIVRRRRRQLGLLWTRLAFFVFLPTILAGTYFYSIATPLYATKSDFVIQQADSSVGGGGLGSLFSGTGFATSQDSITVQSYLQSREAMLRLDQDIGFKDHFNKDYVDPFQRLTPGGTNEEAYSLYKRMVKISYDTTEGLIRMEVIATDPAVSRQFSLALIKYAEEQVDNLTQRLREDQMKGSRESFEDAERKMLNAHQRVLELQEQLGIFDPMSESSALMGQISNYQAQVREKGLELQQLLDNERPNQARVDGVKGDISRLENLIEELRAELTESGEDTESLAKISGQMRLAEVELETRQAMMTQALQQLETARIEANRQTRYLSLGVSPVAPDEATYPRAFENTVVAFLIFAGMYLMASLTVSILREQVTG